MSNSNEQPKIRVGTPGPNFNPYIEDRQPIQQFNVEKTDAEWEEYQPSDYRPRLVFMGEPVPDRPEPSTGHPHIQADFEAAFDNLVTEGPLEPLQPQKSALDGLYEKLKAQAERDRGFIPSFEGPVTKKSKSATKDKLGQYWSTTTTSSTSGFKSSHITQNKSPFSHFNPDERNGLVSVMRREIPTALLNSDQYWHFMRKYGIPTDNLPHFDKVESIEINQNNELIVSEKATEVSDQESDA